jgi:predicted phage tail protein
VTLNWTPPTQNIDGTPLTNLAGYDIHYGTQSHAYTQSIRVSNPGIATYVVDNLTPGTYYFTVTAVNSQGAQSPLSSEVRTTVN